ncbi:Ribosomal RNA small subunit methyltransferase H [Frankliniella fusca]|uniref:Ribosomal RNA small subunit methyltransferase H n=1 Tax=Frankliniella fusca TaxID=407009 RepID=A0AAE1L9P8_9NEOP|nr:Ribosomal RNA small subunit methyltransferase H [Frankliniella fusca]
MTWISFKLSSDNKWTRFRALIIKGGLTHIVMLILSVSPKLELAENAPISPKVSLSRLLRIFSMDFLSKCKCKRAFSIPCIE